MVCSRPIAVILLSSTALVLVGRFAAAQEGCDNGKRDATAAEAKAYRDGYALFQRMAPPTPTNWTAEDSHSEDHITWVCVDAFLDYQRWHFSRTFKLGQAEVDARGAGLEELDYPFHDWSAVVTRCGRICYLSGWRRGEIVPLPRKPNTNARSFVLSNATANVELVYSLDKPLGLPDEVSVKPKPAKAGLKTAKQHKTA